MYSVHKGWVTQNDWYHGYSLNSTDNCRMCVPHGEGYYENNELQYRGQWNNGIKEGNGTIIYKNEQIAYSGQWKNNEFNGKGTIYFNSENYYEGEWENSKINGYGKEKTSHDEYKGYFLNDERNGLGVQLSNQLTYLGNWKNNVRCGVGILSLSNENTFIGIFSSNEITGNFLNIDEDNNLNFGFYEEGKKKSNITKEEIKEILVNIINSNIPNMLKCNEMKFSEKKINFINYIFGESTIIGQEETNNSMQTAPKINALTDIDMMIDNIWSKSVCQY